MREDHSKVVVCLSRGKGVGGVISMKGGDQEVYQGIWYNAKSSGICILDRLPGSRIV